MVDWYTMRSGTANQFWYDCILAIVIFLLEILPESAIHFTGTLIFLPLLSYPISSSIQQGSSFKKKFVGSKQSPQRVTSITQNLVNTSHQVQAQIKFHFSQCYFKRCVIKWFLYASKLFIITILHSYLYN